MYVSDPETAERRNAAKGNTAQEKAWAVAATVCDPEIPVLTIADLGILRDVQVSKEPSTTTAAWFPAVQVTITPTYSGLPRHGRHPG